MVHYQPRRPGHGWTTIPTPGNVPQNIGTIARSPPTPRPLVGADRLPRADVRRHGERNLTRPATRLAAPRQRGGRVFADEVLGLGVRSVFAFPIGPAAEPLGVLDRVVPARVRPVHSTGGGRGPRLDDPPKPSRTTELTSTQSAHRCIQAKAPKEGRVTDECGLSASVRGHHHRRSAAPDRLIAVNRRLIWKAPASRRAERSVTYWRRLGRLTREPSVTEVG